MALLTEQLPQLDGVLRDKIIKAMAEASPPPPSLFERLERSNNPPAPFIFKRKDNRLMEDFEEGSQDVSDVELTFLRDALEMSDANEKALEQKLKEEREISDTLRTRIEELERENEKLRNAPKVIYEPAF